MYKRQGKKNLIVNDTLDAKFVKSAANIPGVQTASTGINTYDVVNADKLILSVCLLYTSWTPINYQTLFGLQGRYWLPILPLVLVICKCGRNITLRHDTSRGAALAVTCLLYTSFVA